MFFLKKNRTLVSFCLGGALVLWSTGLYAASQSSKNTPALSVTHYLMGLIHDWNGETDKAIAEFEQAKRFDSESYVIRLKLGANYARAGKLPQAIEELKSVIALNPEDLQARYILALVYSAEQDYDKAADQYEVILKKFSVVDPQNLEVYGYLGQLYYSQRKFDKAIEQFEHMLTLEPKNVEIIFMLGSVYLDKQDRPKAMEYFKKALEIDPEHENSLNSLGYMYAEDGDNLDEAVTLVKKALELSPDNGAYLDSLGWVYYKKGMYAEALNSLTKAADLYKDPVIYEHLGDVCYKMSNNTDAEKYWKMSLELFPEQEAITQKLNALKKGEAAVK